MSNLEKQTYHLHWMRMPIKLKIAYALLEERGGSPGLLKEMSEDPVMKKHFAILKGDRIRETLGNDAYRVCNISDWIDSWRESITVWAKLLGVQPGDNQLAPRMLDIPISPDESDAGTFDKEWKDSWNIPWRVQGVAKQKGK